MGNVTLLHGDCLDLLPTLPSQSVALVLSDWPYGTTACAWDSVIPLDKLWPEIKRVLTPRGAVVLTASQPFTTTLISSNRAWFRYTWVWEKPIGTGFLDANRKPLKCHEDICVFYAKQPTYNPQKWQGAVTHATARNRRRHTRSIYRGGYARLDSDMSGLKYPRSVVKFAKYSTTERLHPSQKPLALMEYLINTYSNPGDCVLDNAAGSFTTGEAAIRLQRAFIGMERDPGYYAIGAARCAAAQAAYQPALLEVGAP